MTDDRHQTAGHQPGQSDQVTRREQTKQFGRKVTVRLGTQALIRLRGLFVLPIFARILGAVEYGIWSQITVTIRLLLPVLMLRLNAAAVRHLAAERDREEIAAGFYSMFCLILAVVGGLTVVGWLFAPFLAYAVLGESQLALYVLPFLVLLAAKVVVHFLLSYYRTFLRIGSHSAWLLAQNGMEIGVIVLTVVMLRWALPLVLWCVAAANVGFGLFLFTRVHREIPFRRPRFALLQQYLGYSLPLVPNGALLWVINLSDRYVITHFLGLEEVAVYSAAYAVGHLSAFFVDPISFVLFPLLARLWNEDQVESARYYLERSMRYYLMIAVPCVLGVFFIAPYLVRRLAGDAFVTSRFLVLLIAVGFSFRGLYQISVYVLHLARRTRYILYAMLAGAGANLSLNLVLVPRFGIVSAALTTAIAYLMLATLVVAYSRRFLVVQQDFVFLGKCLLSGGIMFGAVWLFAPVSLWAIITVVFVGIGVYSGCLLLLRAVGRRELAALRSLVH